MSVKNNKKIKKKLSYNFRSFVKHTKKFAKEKKLLLDYVKKYENQNKIITKSTSSHKTFVEEINADIHKEIISGFKTQIRYHHEETIHHWKKLTFSEKKKLKLFKPIKHYPVFSPKDFHENESNSGDIITLIKNLDCY